MEHIHKILSVFRFFEHGTFIVVLGFILFDTNNNNANNKSNNDFIVGFEIYIFVSFVIVYGLYYYIVIFDKDAIQRQPTSTNRTLRQLWDLEMYDEIFQMYIFGFKYSDQDWCLLMKDKSVDNDKIVHALDSFLSHDVIEVDKIFSAIESDINARDSRRSSSKTVLHYAVDDRHGSVECVSKLLKHNANPNIKDSDGETPLHLAVRYSQGKVRLLKIDLLLKAGADVNAINDAHKDGLTPLHYAAIEISRHDCIDLLLDASSINVNATDTFGKTALDYAIDASKYTEKESISIQQNTIAKLTAAGCKCGQQLQVETEVL